ncbi:NodT family efflux transporter outer membrane factor (OMF) lipoprotein [Chryseobacterium bernardetii]|uniref:NodT family efflux transporter outer membrane factor (OMF) lipoprotein n=2 Tax=Chryseobacterium TaxID=59732 RepID=A0A543EGG6_9FLAO|nr:MULTISPECIES: TolC family protein [Chryseobacterium]MDR6370724.1 NodT family efflux transporter outer membrane factor (OMF) lipoprotein [Chryseobacterium vietnamense]MDR6441730.1 NodT family efflux transporter outer membrane factor (OMF) lipoprotein [Chryseobacterium bernardetii]TQM20681.1 NodT family efflux transporter outer membrane factor (OMF) lipoprotein [Chryseobacterium aquifrigidense]
MYKKLILVSVLAVSLSSCIGYKEATKENIDQLKEKSEIASHLQIPDDWIFDRKADPKSISYDWINDLKTSQLEALINEGMLYNADLIIAREKLNQVELAMEIAGSDLYPSVSAVANTSNNLVSGSQVQRLALKANWEIDLWGKNKSSQMASTSSYFSAKHQNTLLHQSIAGMIAKAYFLNIAGNIQEDKIESYIQKTKDLEKLYIIQKKVGTANAIDVSNISAEIISLQGYLEKIKNANMQSRRSLELLTGKYPEGKLATQNFFTPVKSNIPESFPLELLENRSDIQASHFQIEKAFYEVQEAKAARLPSLSISSSLGSAGSNVEAINSLFSNPLLKVGGGLVSPLFNGGKLKKNVEVKNSQQKQVVEEYSKAVLNALNEVESSLANLRSIEKQMTYTTNAVNELKNNISLTEKQIKVGTSNSFVLIRKQRDLLKNEMNLINLELQYRIERINLYMALGAENFIYS